MLRWLLLLLSLSFPYHAHKHEHAQKHTNQMSSAPAAGSGADARPSETPKDLKKRVRGLDKSLTSVHDRLVQTEKQIFDLERSYLEETRLYGNVLQGWDAYLDTKGKGKGGKGGASGGGGGRGGGRGASEDGEEGAAREGRRDRPRGGGRMLCGWSCRRTADRRCSLSRAKCTLLSVWVSC